jgi:dipeptidyl aminopeptidase/acylaminoacyl peptidase
MDAATGAPRALFEEKAETFIDYSQKTWLHWLDKTGEFLWMSERSGWNHLYLCDARTGAVKNAVTSGDWLVRSVERVDVEQRRIEFKCMGIHKAQDPYHMHFARVNFDGTGLTLLTEGDGTHTIDYSPDQQTYVDTWSRADQAPVHELRRASDGKLLCELNRADISALQAAGWPAPQRFTAPGRDGKTSIHGLILRPWGYDAAKKYPVIEYIYAGPHDFFVPKEFRRWNRHWELANLGFILVFIDGMGTNWRSRAFHDVAWRNIGDAGFPDRIAWMKAAAAAHPEMDLSRVGIFGGSAGGQNAMRALIAHGDFYHCAAADCGCHDNRMDKVWWNEAWMGYPVGPHYSESSNVDQAHRLKGHLLLTVGEVDTNVDPASTMQVANALINAGKDFELLIVPNSDHGAGESPYAAQRRAQFFMQRLLGTPRAAN